MISLHARKVSFEKEIQKRFPEGIDKKLKKYIWFNYIYEKILNKTLFSDYMQYEFYRYNSRTRKEFITEQKRIIIDKTFNTPNGNRIFNDKATFNKMFSQYINRDWLYVKEATFEEFCLFCEKNNVFFAKSVDGWFGIGARVISVDKNTNLEQLYNELADHKMIIEQLIHQHKEMDEFNSTSVNTLRVVTVLRPNGSVEIVTADLRVGRLGKTSDNFHNNGIAALIDIDSGIVYTTGVDKIGKRYVLHPDSGKQIVGFKVPFWEKIQEITKSAAKVVKDVRYVGWDVAIDEDGHVLIIEGNCCADPDVSQMPDRMGKWPIYVSLIEEAKKSKIAE